MRGKTVGIGAVLALAGLEAACAAGGAASTGSWMDGGSGSTLLEAGPVADAGGVSPAGAIPIYVSTSGDDTAPGTSPGSPVKSIQTGLDLAAACPGAPCSVLVAAGTYTQSLQLRDGVSVYGQYAPDFSGRAAANVVTITSADANTVVASGLTKTTTLDGLTIKGASLSSADGRSTYAVWVHASMSALFLSNSDVTGGAAAAGTPGSAGGSLTCQSTGGAAGTSSDCSSNPGGSGAASGDPVVGGGGGGGGSSNCPDACPLVNSDGVSSGGAGTPGGDGANGPGGIAASNVFGTFSAGLWAGTAGGAGGRGMHGTGGGGGGSGGTKHFAACFGCSSLLGGDGAPGGAGGCAGSGGGPGGPGGGSFALVTDSNVTLSDVAIVGGTGGAGGQGGAGAAGQSGIMAAGSPGPAAEQECGLIDYESGGGAPGAAGGAGGGGGGGAGGAGGPSIAVVTTAGGRITQYGGSILTGTPGAGGPGGLGGGGAPTGAVGLMGGAAGERAY